SSCLTASCAVPMPCSRPGRKNKTRRIALNRPSRSRLIAVTLATSAMMLAPAALLHAQEGPGAGTTVRMAQATWDTGWFPAAVYKQVLEKLGYTVEGPTTLDNPPFYQAVSQGDLDLWVNGWFPLHN